MYTEKVMDHFINPRNVGEIEDASGVGEVGNAKCGDIMQIYIKVDETTSSRDVKFKTFGCGAAIATVQPRYGDGQGQNHRRGPENHQQNGRRMRWAVCRR